ncbi:hypothetical protein [Candidatus Phytoplasma australiense]|uniref:Uncharacterized protein n=1 Tax=Strawberry lethal yellows phytoplasma (CPA) str. NZSb11 TaxID=980422 RepID=R4S1Y8_PHYAS|nr:hypothetical protein [Candidatus Phytoplasma australiense]AGL90818.1 Hypothetical Protein SLY_0903 [Strawberry lethal yellows phytoplasma (CPA) str. NZSb11]
MNNYPNYPTPFPQKNNKLLYSIIAIVSAVIVIFAIIFFYNKNKTTSNPQNPEQQETPNNRNTSNKPNSQKHTPTHPENTRPSRTSGNPSDFSGDNSLPSSNFKPQDEKNNKNTSNSSSSPQSPTTPQFYTNTPNPNSSSSPQSPTDSTEEINHLSAENDLLSQELETLFNYDFKNHSYASQKQITDPLVFTSSNLNGLNYELGDRRKFLNFYISAFETNNEHHKDCSTVERKYIKKEKELYNRPEFSPLNNLTKLNNKLKEEKTTVEQRIKESVQQIESRNLLYPTFSKLKSTNEELEKISTVVKEISRMYSNIHRNKEETARQANTKYTQIKADAQTKNIILPNIPFN